MWETIIKGQQAAKDRDAQLYSSASANVFKMIDLLQQRRHRKEDKDIEAEEREYKKGVRKEDIERSDKYRKEDVERDEKRFQSTQSLEKHKLGFQVASQIANITGSPGVLFAYTNLFKGGGGSNGDKNKGGSEKNVLPQPVEYDEPEFNSGIQSNLDPKDRVMYETQYQSLNRASKELQEIKGMFELAKRQYVPNLIKKAGNKVNGLLTTEYLKAIGIDKDVANQILQEYIGGYGSNVELLKGVGMLGGAAALTKGAIDLGNAGISLAMKEKGYQFGEAQRNDALDLFLGKTNDALKQTEGRLVKQYKRIADSNIIRYHSPSATISEQLSGTAYMRKLKSSNPEEYNRVRKLIDNHRKQNR